MWCDYEPHLIGKTNSTTLYDSYGQYQYGRCGFRIEAPPRNKLNKNKLSTYKPLL